MLFSYTNDKQEAF